MSSRERIEEILFEYFRPYLHISMGFSQSIEKADESVRKIISKPTTALSAEFIPHEEYEELIMAVETKYPNETRHETALRYIRQFETKLVTAQAALADGPEDQR